MWTCRVVAIAMTLGACGRFDFSELPSDAVDSTPWLPDFLYRIPLELDPAVATSDLIDVPVLIALDPTRMPYAHAAADGSDIRFTGADGTSLIPHELERWTPDGRSIVWVRAPGDTRVWLYYGSSAPPPSLPATEVWSDGFAAVWHFEDLHDSTGHGLDLTAMSAPAAEGELAGARDFTSTASYMRAPDDPRLHMTQSSSMTLTAHAFPRVVDGNLFRYDDCDITDGDQVCPRALYALRLAPGGGTNFYFGDNSLTLGDLQSTSTNVSADNWHTVAAVRNVATTSCASMVDGELSSGPDASTGTWETTGEYLLLGRYYDGSYESFDGLIDEARIASVARSDAWLRMDNASLTDTLVAYGSEQIH